MEIQQRIKSTRMVEPKHHDTYKIRGKLPEPTVCGVCGAVFQEGRWSWAKPIRGAHKATCPACHRIADRFPAGRVEMGGAFFKEHRDEILRLVRNEEAVEKKERPLERIMAIAEEADKTVITTTGIHIARRIGESLSHSYRGTFDYSYGDGEDSIRVTWSR